MNLILLPILFKHEQAYIKESMGLEADDYSDSYNKRVWVNPNNISSVFEDDDNENYSRIIMSGGDVYICAYKIDKLLTKLKQ